MRQSFADGAYRVDFALMWYALVEDEQLGPMEGAELGGLLRQGVVSPETLVWREGMEEWLPFGEVADLGRRRPAPEPAPQVFAPPDDPDDFEYDDDSSEDGDGATVMLQPGEGPDWDALEAADAATPAPFSGAAPLLAPPAQAEPLAVEATPAAVASAMRSAPFEPIPAPESIAPVRPSGPLFGEQSLAENAPAPQPGADDSRLEPLPGFDEVADDDSIELIDFMDLEPEEEEDEVAPARQGPPAPRLGFGAAASPAPFAPPLAQTPLVTPKKSKTGLIAVLVLLVLGAVGVTGYFVLNKPPEPPAPTPKAPMEPVKVSLSNKGEDAGAPAPDAAQPVRPADAGVAAGDAGAATDGGASDAAQPTADAAQPVDAAPVDAAPAVDAAKVAAATPKKVKPKRRRVYRPKPAPSNLPVAPSRDDMLAVLKANAAKLKVCGDGTAVTIAVSVRIKRDGKVSSAKVATGKYRGTDLGKCVEKQVRGYKFKPFSGDPLRITLPLKI